MLYKFKSRASGDVIMLGHHAQALLKLIGKDPSSPKGILLPEQMPAALDALRRAIEAEKGGSEVDAGTTSAEAAADAERDQDAVSLRQRAWPLMQMIERSQAENREITWGV